MKLSTILALSGIILLGSETFAQRSTNLLKDPSFETTHRSEPDLNSKPWFAEIEDQDWSFITHGFPSRTGSQSVGRNFYYAIGAIVQNTGIRAARNARYEFSVWATEGDKTDSDGSHGIPTFKLQIWTAKKEDGEYRFRLESPEFRPSEEGEWEQFKLTTKERQLREGEFIQVRIFLERQNVSHRTFFDDAALRAID